jgi:formylmethanofuran dehydrogenase subunit E
MGMLRELWPDAQAALRGTDWTCSVCGEPFTEENAPAVQVHDGEETCLTCHCRQMDRSVER